MIAIFVIKPFFALQAEGHVVGAFVMPHGKFLALNRMYENYSRFKNTADCFWKIEIARYKGALCKQARGIRPVGVGGADGEAGHGILAGEG